MRFQMSSNVAVRTPRYTDAVAFYTEVLGFENRSSDADLDDLDASPLSLFILEDSEAHGPVMELFFDDLEQARESLVAHGSESFAGEVRGKIAIYRIPSE